MSAEPPLLHFDIHPGVGPYLLLVHGFLSSRAQWQPNLEALASVCRPVTVELWGHGRSPAPADPSAYTPQGYIAGFERIRRLIGTDAWFVCGYSLGAGLTIRYAHDHPQTVIAHTFTNSMSAFADRALQAQWSSTSPAIAEKILILGEQAIRKLAVHPRHARSLMPALKRALVADADLLRPVAVANTLTITTLQSSIRPVAAHNPRPALLIQGEKERRFADYAAWARLNMPKLSVAQVDAGHGVNMEQPADFNHALSDFIQGQGAP